MMFIIASIVTAFSQAPLSIAEDVMIDGEHATVTRKSSTDIVGATPTKIYGSLVATFDCEANCDPDGKKMKLVQIDEKTKEWTATYFDFRCIDRGNWAVLESGRWFVSEVPIREDELAVIECILDRINLTTQYEIITYSKRNVMRKIHVPDYGQVKVTIMKIRDYIKKK